MEISLSLNETGYFENNHRNQQCHISTKTTILHLSKTFAPIHHQYMKQHLSALSLLCQKVVSASLQIHKTLELILRKSNSFEPNLPPFNKCFKTKTNLWEDLRLSHGRSNYSKATNKVLQMFFLFIKYSANFAKTNL